jgi:hypothetical protein
MSSTSQVDEPNHVVLTLSSPLSPHDPGLGLREPMMENTIMSSDLAQDLAPCPGSRLPEDSSARDGGAANRCGTKTPGEHPIFSLILIQGTNYDRPAGLRAINARVSRCCSPSPICEYLRRPIHIHASSSKFSLDQAYGGERSEVCEVISSLRNVPSQNLSSKSSPTSEQVTALKLIFCSLHLMKQ